MRSIGTLSHVSCSIRASVRAAAGKFNQMPHQLAALSSVANAAFTLMYQPTRVDGGKDLGGQALEINGRRATDLMLTPRQLPPFDCGDARNL
jgi:hypothetical protein